MTSLPESSINQACGSWSEAKAAYRFFQNENIKESEILSSHVAKTVERTKAHKRILVIQDTSCISYTGHEKTSGLATISRKCSKGIMVHTAFAVSTEGLTLGILDQKIYSRSPVSEEEKELRSHHNNVQVEECRLGTAERLMRYLTVMSVIAWRIFFITSIARTDPTLPCTTLLAEEEWKVLYVKMHKKPCLNVTPTIKEAVSWIAQLGGHLARKSDPEPGPITLWKGWRRLFDLAEGL